LFVSKEVQYDWQQVLAASQRADHHPRSTERPGDGGPHSWRRCRGQVANSTQDIRPTAFFVERGGDGREVEGAEALRLVGGLSAETAEDTSIEDRVQRRSGVCGRGGISGSGKERTDVAGEYGTVGRVGEKLVEDITLK
jgi:hypothetical protein